MGKRKSDCFNQPTKLIAVTLEDESVIECSVPIHWEDKDICFYLSKKYGSTGWWVFNLITFPG